MLPLGSTMGKLAREATRTTMPGWARDSGGDDATLEETAEFGFDPGGLRMLSFVPDDLPANAPLVVVLHGCTQTGAGYARASGWVDLARRHGFALLVPEQRRCNNANLCFNWFEPADVARGGGEVASIHTMIQHFSRVKNLDRRRVFVTGLSAGGAMTAALLATYPETFAAGAIVAGLPFGCAADTRDALEQMTRERRRPARSWGDLVRAASPHRGPWPRVAVWHGTADATVRPANAGESVKQWLDVQGLAEGGFVVDRLDGQVRRRWRGADGRAGVELVLVEGMGHGTPIAPRAARADQRCGTPAPHVLDVGVSSTARIAEFFGLAPESPAGEAAGEGARAPLGGVLPDIGRTIADALRSAGLIRKG